MAILVGGAKPVNTLDIFTDGLLDLTLGTVTVATATAYRVTSPTNSARFDEFTGTFVYDADGHLISGTITGWRHSSPVDGFTLTGLSIDVADFLTSLDGNDTAGFLSAVFDGGDTMTGTALADHIKAYGGDDKVSGHGGNDQLEGDAGKDTLDGGAGDDTIDGGADNDSLLGGAGDDSLSGGAGDDTMVGGAGDDLYEVLDAGDKVEELPGGGVDVIESAIDFDLSANATNIEILQLTGTAKVGVGNGLDNIIGGTDSDDTLSGNGGDDTLIGGTGADSMTGGTGDDAYGIDDKNDTVVEEADGGDDTVLSVIDFDLGVSAANVENLILGAGAVTGTGNVRDNVILGNDDDNTLDGAAGQDTLAGGSGNDVYVVDDSDDQIIELATDGTVTLALANGGDDTVLASADYVLGANLESLILTDTGAATAGTGNKLDNALIGNKLANKLVGLAGNDIILDAEGNDTLDGGVGKDQIAGGADNDSILGGADDDTLEGEGGDDTLDGGAGNDQLVGGEGADNLTGGNGIDTLAGDGGADTMAGGIAGDFYEVDDAGDEVIEAAGAGFDRIVSSIDITKLADNVEELALVGKATTGVGNKYNNLIIGGDNSDTLTGGLGNDTLTGGLGIDELIGEAGDDIYDVDDAGDVVTELATPGSGKDTVRSTAATFTLSANVESLILIGAAAIGIGNGLGNAITGNDAANTLEGAGGNDILAGGLGDDKLTGGDGTDTLQGGKGGDTYVVLDSGDKVVEFVGQGTDRVIASKDYVLGSYVENLELADTAAVGKGNALGNEMFSNAALASKLSGLGGSDTLHGSNLANTLDGGVGNDSVVGGDGNENLVGGAGDDTLIGNLGDDTMTGGAGNDFYSIDSAKDKVVELPGEGTDTIESGINFDLATDGANVENLSLVGTATLGGGDELNNQITGNASPDSLTGAAGNDTLIGGAGDDTMTGDAGDDVYFVDDSDDEVVEDPGPAGGKDTIRSDIDIAALTANVENLTLLAGLNGTGNELGNVITGNDSANTLEGEDGDDSLVGGVGEDNLDGGDGADTLVGGKDDDSYEVDDGSDKIVELAGQGIDLVESSADHTLAANVENLTLTGAAAIGVGNAVNNEISGNDEANKLSGLGANDVLSGEAESDTLDGGVGDDKLDGGDDNDSLIGGAGKDSLDGGGGADTMAGGGGDDSYVFGAGDTILEGKGQGIDSVKSDVDVATLFDNVENLTLTGAATLGGGNALNNLIEGTAAGDSLVGAAGNDTLTGGAGKDAMAGNSGNDVFDVDDSQDVVTEQAGEGTDTIRSSIDFDLSIGGKNVENLTLLGAAISGTGNEFANVIVGNAGDNSLSGGDNKDSLTGGDGSDTLNGEAGVDTMVGGKDGDTYSVDSVGDKVVESALKDGTNLKDRVNTLIDNYVLAANVEELVLTEIPTIVTGTGNGSDNAIQGNDIASNKLFGLGGHDSMTGKAGDDTLDGGAGNDTLEGGADSDSLVGGAGGDALDGGAGADIMAGGAGDDVYTIDNAGDKVIEAAGQGIDTVKSSIADTTLDKNVEHLTISLAGDVTATGNDLNNRITDEAGNAKLDGGAGDDTLIGGDGDDQFTGGAGRDTFVIRGISGGAELITDFKAGSTGDKLDVSELLSGFDAGTDNPNDFVKFIIVGDDTVVQVDADGAGVLATFVDVATLQGVALTSVNQAVVEGNLGLG